MSSTEESTSKIQFKKKKVKSLRKRTGSSDDDSDGERETVRDRLDEMKTIQKLRQRPHGVNIAGLALGEKVTADLTSDPFNVKNGGMVNMAALKNTKLKQPDDAYDTGIGTQFSAETNKRDEDEEMMKYIEEQLSKRKNKNPSTSDAHGDGDGGSYCSPEEAALQAVPEHLRQSSANRSEEMLSNQMLSGIPEVDLGIEAKIRNIEATEEAKLKLLWERHRKKDGPSQFVPTNMAVNFVQHNRFNIEDSDVQKGKRDAEERKRLAARKDDANGKRKDNGEKATDDYHYERFKKQFRRF
ncbi:telomere length and silencing protein 1 homolog isoform X1 [Diprion similis]|uniref:telomere length and silencing protein 1 homolog isoform X1 n=1 Tax=Diprion similis TaxID=362088 RepID=UPI001EF84E7B|nr:telomere length and silencing protein 1 homolog isoform X1 [Diprion similis]